MYCACSLNVFALLLHHVGRATVSIVQEPPSVQVGNNVTFSCNATAEKKIKTLKWMANGVDLRQHDDGVIYFPQPTLGQLNVSSVLTLLSTVVNKEGERWPKNIKCRVELEFEKGTKHSDTYFDIQDVKFTSKSLVNTVMGGVLSIVYQNCKLVFHFLLPVFNTLLLNYSSVIFNQTIVAEAFVVIFEVIMTVND